MLSNDVSVPTAPAKESGAPIITLEQAKVRLVEPEFSVAPIAVEGKDGSTFMRDPGLNGQIEILDDMEDGTYDGIRFYQNFRLLWDEENQRWELRAGGSLGALVNAHTKTKTGKPYDFKSKKPFTFKMDEWDGFEFMTKIVPKKNPQTKQLCGSMCLARRLLGDLAYRSRRLKGSLAERGILLVTKRAEQRGFRQQVEIAFASLKRVFRLGETLATTLTGLATRIAAKMTAYTYAFVVNRLLG